MILIEILLFYYLSIQKKMKWNDLRTILTNKYLIKEGNINQNIFYINNN